MKILDRYILISFIKNYLISLMVLIGLYIVLDMVFNFDELAEVQSKQNAGGVLSVVALLRSIADYYFFQTFRIFIHLSGIIPIVAAAFTLIRLARFNELTASLAAGVPLLRTAMPIIIVAMILNVLLVLDQELLIPRMIPKLTRRHDEIQQVGPRSFPVRAMQDEQKGLLSAARYHPGTDRARAWMEQVDIIQVDESFMPVAHIVADRGEWDPRDSQWKLHNGRRITGLRPNDINPAEEPIPAYRSSITPDEVALYRSGEYVELLPTSRIKELLQRPKSYGTAALQRVKHARFTQPLLNVILLLLAVPCILTREPGRVKQGIFACVFVCGACLATIFLSYQLAGTPPAGAQWADRWPAIMAWMPIIIFGPIAVFLLDRVKT
jgi:lipopolysaccharide export system permease protein